MPFLILDTCERCGECLPECPISAIQVGDPIYIIDNTCCDFEECVAVCPMEAIMEVSKLETDIHESETD